MTEMARREITRIERAYKDVSPLAWTLHRLRCFAPWTSYFWSVHFCHRAEFYNGQHIQGWNVGEAKFSNSSATDGGWYTFIMRQRPTRNGEGDWWVGREGDTCRNMPRWLAGQQVDPQN